MDAAATTLWNDAGFATGYRVAFFTKAKSRTLYTTYICEAMERLGCVVRRYNMGNVRRKVGRRGADVWVRRSVEGFAPNAIVTFSGDIQMETLVALNRTFPTAILLDDYFPVEAPVTAKAKVVDVFFHTMTGQREEYLAAGVKRVVYVHSGVDPQRHRSVPANPRFASDVAFIGGAAYPERIEMIRELHTTVDLKLYGPSWDTVGLPSVASRIEVPEFAEVCASAKIVLGIDKAADRELYFSNRTWFVLGSGGFLLTRYVPGLERLFANRRHLVWFRDVEEARREIAYYLDHPEERARIARDGQDFVHTHYPFDRMARNMLRVLAGKGEPLPFTDPGACLEPRAVESFS